jgi:hypothetical protein
MSETSTEAVVSVGEAAANPADSCQRETVAGEPATPEVGELSTVTSEADQANAEGAPASPVGQVEGETPPEPQPDKGKASREAAKYRSQVRELETQQAELQARLDAADWRTIKESLPYNLPLSLFQALIPDIASVRDDKGYLTDESFNEAMESLLALGFPDVRGGKKPFELGKPPPEPLRGPPLTGSGGNIHAGGPGRSWEGAFKPR